MRVDQIQKNNQDTCINLLQLLKKERNCKRSTFSRGYATENGELALGKTYGGVHPWQGYNFEDAM
ncbi:hypothetical protein JR347_18345 [Fulvivirga lutea]|uniref:DNA-directed RNA polymerase n=1 Tax=Fulvivirga lutea TaxID=2810512 RepID=A0A974WJ72_9BACT|nr:hypothetical protein JR347_18345 [Fulvivirga lutea]